MLFILSNMKFSFQASEQAQSRKLILFVKNQNISTNCWYCCNDELELVLGCYLICFAQSKPISTRFGF